MKGSKKITRRQATERSQSVATHVDMIHSYNERLKNLLENEKKKDEVTRLLEKQLYADKLKHAELVSEVSLGHELMTIEEIFDEEYTTMEQEHEAAGASLREAMGESEELSTRVLLGDVEGHFLNDQIRAAKARFEALSNTQETMASKLETYKANEKAAATRAAALAKRSEEVRAEHSKAFDARPSNQASRKNHEEIQALVNEAKKKREEHHALMKKLHAKEASEIRLFEEEAAAKLAEAEAKYKAQFSKEELKAVAKHESYQKELKAEMARIEERTKGKMEEEEAAIRAKIKKLSADQAKKTTSIEAMRQQVVDFLAERNVHATQVKHLDALTAERTKTREKLAREETVLKADLESTLSATKVVSDKRAKVASKYALVVKQNKKMSAEIDQFSALIASGEAEVEMLPANKRIRLVQDKL